MRSMTGFGAAAIEQSGISLRAEVRTVNHKHLQLKLRLPTEFLQLEPEVEELVKKRLDRGSVSLNISLVSAARAQGPSVQPEVARRLKTELYKLARELKLEPVLSLDTLARLPGVVAAGAEVHSDAKAGKLVLKVAQQALVALESMREAEGRAMAADLKKHQKQLERLSKEVEQRMPLVVAAHHAALAKRVEELLGGRGTLLPGDLAREVALLADKLDVSEELARLRSHFAQFATILARSGPVGRQLEFLVQEFLREANTIGSKCNDAQVAHAVVEMKTLIERLREQVQNVE
jgi:uncharacterized protein (TIGR00255 family)